MLPRKHASGGEKRKEKMNVRINIITKGSSTYIDLFVNE